jgi:hypothetical protein
MNCNSDNKPGLVDTDLNPIKDKTKLYSGCYVRACFNLFPFSGKANGIAAGLNSIQFLEDGEPFGAVSRPELDFEEAWDDSMAAKGVPAAIKTNTAAKAKPSVDDDDPEG